MHDVGFCFAVMAGTGGSLCPKAGVFNVAVPVESEGEDTALARPHSAHPRHIHQPGGPPHPAMTVTYCIRPLCT